MTNFINFFKCLYSTVPETGLTEDELSIDPNIRRDVSSCLNKDITLDELEVCLIRLKNNKAVSEDLISNEFLKNSSQTLCQAILKVFNECLNHGTYPWNTSYVTPLHKKGSIYDPNNYRAIAVGSNLGKLFSSILLGRLLNYRESYAPNPKNQLGFCAGAQTSDHILTLRTCVEKYIKVKKQKLFACFVDFRKAFDTVSRQVLIYKLEKLGIPGRFLCILKHMYSHSTARIKLLQKISEKIDILVGTEQGHPMSFELFKCYISDLSIELNEELKQMNVPMLNGNNMSHLLYADDLVLLALDAECLQKLISKLEEFCLRWGLSVNMTKTKVMIFNSQGRMLNCSKGFEFGSDSIQATKSYTYLGITFNLCGSFKDAMEALRQNALRSYFSLKKLIDWKYLKRSSTIKLIDVLVIPVLTYSCQIWMPYTWRKQYLQMLNPPNEDCSYLQILAKQPAEKAYLACLKWLLGVRKKSSNTAVWGDSGSYPVLVKTSKQVLDYFSRVSADEFKDSYVKDAVLEQKSLGLTWYATLSNIYTRSADVVNNIPTSSGQFKSGARIRHYLQEGFRNHWDKEQRRDRKLSSFYNSCKPEFGTKKYIQLPYNKYEKNIAAIRMSSHKLYVETGRYKPIPRRERICRGCTTADSEIIEGFLHLPKCELPIEDENHCLFYCDYYTDIRTKLVVDGLKSEMASCPPNVFKSSASIKLLGKLAVAVMKKHHNLLQLTNR